MYKLRFIEVKQKVWYLWILLHWTTWFYFFLYHFALVVTIIYFYSFTHSALLSINYIELYLIFWIFINIYQPRRSKCYFPVINISCRKIKQSHYEASPVPYLPQWPQEAYSCLLPLCSLRFWPCCWTKRHNCQIQEHIFFTDMFSLAFVVFKRSYN